VCAVPGFLVNFGIEPGIVIGLGNIYDFSCFGHIASQSLPQRQADFHHILSLEDVIVKSSNIGTVKAAELLGKEKLYAYIRKFGFGQKTGVELPGEIRGIVRKRSWDDVSSDNRPERTAQVPLTPDQEQQLEANLEKQVGQSTNYDLCNNNCANFVEDELDKVGVSLPDDYVEYPEDTLNQASKIEGASCPIEN